LSVSGSAIAPKKKWHEEKTTIINVYAPKNRSEHPGFWERLELERDDCGFNSPDFLFWDFNVRET
jgi:hypothetical protein